MFNNSFIFPVEFLVSKVIKVSTNKRWLGDKAVPDGDNNIVKLDNKLLKKYYKEKILSSSQAIQQGVKDICKKNLKY